MKQKKLINYLIAGTLGFGVLVPVTTLSTTTVFAYAKVKEMDMDYYADFMDGIYSDKYADFRKDAAKELGVKNYKDTRKEQDALAAKVKKHAEDERDLYIRYVTKQQVDFLKAHLNDSKYSSDRATLAGKIGSIRYHDYKSEREALLKKTTEAYNLNVKLSKEQEKETKEKEAREKQDLINKINASYKGASIVEYLNQANYPSSFAEREKLAGKLGIYNYEGTSAQNTLMLKILRSNGS